MGVFAGKSSDIENVADGATFGVPNDPTNEGHALLLLQDLGLITLADDAGTTATPNDIVDNPKNLKFSEQEAVALPRTLNDVDFAVINGNYAIDAGLALEDAVAQEDANSAVIQDEYANVIVTTPELEDDERIVALVAALQTDDQGLRSRPLATLCGRPLRFPLQPVIVISFSQEGSVWGPCCV